MARDGQGYPRRRRDMMMMMITRHMKKTKLGATTERKPTKKNFFCFLAILSQQTLSSEMIVFIALCGRNQTYLFKGISQTDWQKKKLYLILKNILDEFIHVEQRFKTTEEFRFVELLNLNFFFSRLKKKKF